MADFKSKLSQLRLRVPRSVLHHQQQPNTRRTFWLAVLLDAISILVHYEDQAHDDDEYPDAISGPAADPHDLRPQIPKYVLAANNATRRLDDALAVSTELLLNPFLAPVWFLCCRAKVLHWVATKDGSARSAINTLLSALDLLSAEGSPVAKLYRDAAVSDLTAEPGKLLISKKGGLRLLSHQITQWLF